MEPLEYTRIEPLVEAARRMPADAIANLRARGLQPHQRDAEADVALREAQPLIDLVPELASTIGRRVRGIGLLNSAGPEYDISHSEPRWPRWIFLSIPPCGPLRALRIAEAVIHEAMHHNLSALEETMTLALTEDRLYSPWKRERRKASGVLHGLYVFACLIASFAHLRRTGIRGAAARAAEIDKEIGTIDRLALEACLTPAGQRLVTALYAVTDAVRPGPPAVRLRSGERWRAS